MTPLQTELHEERAERLERFEAAADDLLQRQVKRFAEQFEAQDTLAAINAEKLAKLDKAFAECPPLRRQQICREVRHKHGFTWKEMIGESHALKLCAARREAWARLRAETTMSYPQIGRLFKRDHSTIIHGVQRWQARQGAQ